MFKFQQISGMRKAVQRLSFRGTAKDDSHVLSKYIYIYIYIFVFLIFKTFEGSPRANVH